MIRSRAVWTAVLCLCLGLPVAAEILDVTSYGAVPDDSGDDRSAINAAISAAASGDTVFFPAGVYRVSDSINGKSGVALIGSGQAEAVIQYMGGGEVAMISLSGDFDVEIAELTLDGNLADTAGNGIVASNGSGHYLHHLTIRNFGMTSGGGPLAIHFTNAVTDSEISDNTIENIGVGDEWGAGIRLSWNSSRNKVLRNTISDTGRGGVLCNDDSMDLVIQENTVSGSGGVGLGIEVWGGCDRALIEDNVIDHWLSVDASDQVAVRRNTVSDKGGDYKLCGLELVSSVECVFTGNLVDDGAHVGLSVSNDQPKEHIYWGYNTIQYCSTWGSQIQGDTDGAKYQYFYKNKFLNMYRDHPDAWFSGQGHGFRFNGNCRYITMDENEICDNGRLGIQCSGSSTLDQLSFVDNIITGNGGSSIDADPGTDLEWANNTVSGNGTNTQLSSRGFSNQKPTASFTCPDTALTGQAISFVSTSSDPDGMIGFVLWDFDDGLPSTAMNPTYTYERPGTYRVTLLVWDTAGRGALAEKTVQVSSTGAVEQPVPVSQRTPRLAAFPNPSRGGVMFQDSKPYVLVPNPYSLVTIYDSTGRLVRALNPQPSTLNPEGRIFWNGRDAAGRPLPSGTYFYRLNDGRTDRIVLAR